MWRSRRVSIIIFATSDACPRQTCFLGSWGKLGVDCSSIDADPGAGIAHVERPSQGEKVLGPARDRKPGQRLARRSLTLFATVKAWLEREPFRHLPLLIGGTGLPPVCENSLSAEWRRPPRLASPSMAGVSLHDWLNPPPLQGRSWKLGKQVACMRAASL
jgi:hypothetical protein